MKKIQKLYYILTYVFFIWPPFIWGLVEIYKEGNKMEVHIVSLIVNISLIFAIAITCGLLHYAEKIHLPSKTELKYLLFGLIGNIVVYFYTFQNFMEIENLINVYIVLLIILAVHYFLISRKITVWELWILLPIFLVIDYLHLLITGCGFTTYSSCTPNTGYNGLLYFFYYIIFLSTFGYYAYRIYLYKLWDFFKIANIVAIVILSYAVQEFVTLNQNFLGTVAIFMAFFTIVDIIVKVIEKTYTHTLLLFYIRSYSIFMLFGLLAEERFFKGHADEGTLVIMVVFTYISLLINILKSVLQIDIKVLPKPSTHGIKIQICREENIKQILLQYGDKLGGEVTNGENVYNLIAVKDDIIVGFISTEIRELETPLEDISEAYIKVIEVHKDYRNFRVATRLIERTEKHFMALGINQIRGWASAEQVEFIDFWNKLDFSFSSATIWVEETMSKQEGYYIIKKLM